MFDFYYTVSAASSRAPRAAPLPHRLAPLAPPPAYEGASRLILEAGDPGQLPTGTVLSLLKSNSAKSDDPTHLPSPPTAPPSRERMNSNTRAPHAHPNSQT